MAEEPKKTRAKKGTGGMRYRADKDVWIASADVGFDAQGNRVRLEATGKTEYQAQQRLNKKVREYHKSPTQSKAAKGTVAEWLDKWLNEVRRGRIRPTTKRSYDSHIRNHINPVMGKKKLAKLTPEDIRQMMRDIEKRQADARKAAAAAGSSTRVGDGPRCAKYAHTIMRKALGDAVREGLVPRNVASKDYVEPMGAVEKEQKALDAAQARNFLRIALESNDPWATRWAAALLTGTRQGELIGLTWDRVDFENKRLYFTKQLQLLGNTHGCGEADENGLYPCGKLVARACPKREFDIDEKYRSETEIISGSIAWVPTKTKMSKRALPMIEPLAKILRAHQAMTAGQPNPHNLVWHEPDGRPLNPRKDYDNWLAALDRAGLEHVKLHSTRASAASIMSEMGIDREVIAEILGHTNLSTTALYAKVGETYRREALSSLGSLVDMFGESDGGHTPALDA
ncbi:integrase [Gordonia phage BrutonGaster]|uniref:Integrase n=1 Tax=Gordonia phage BrutonGaster TaxID=2530116 RepID=A0A482JN57_9CAUD|nr:integrase [Gordonia phage BrutonGaster]QBP33284.1 integrase [Gordonia phage BrutonGaster]